MAALRAIQSTSPAPRTMTGQAPGGAVPKAAPPVSEATPADSSPNQSSDMADRLAGRLSISSHTVSLSTRFFHLDYTWRNLDIDPPAQGPLQPDNEPACQARPVAPQNRREVLRRMKLASLLDDPPPNDSRAAPAAPPAERMAAAVRGRMAYFGQSGGA
jgi:hypothetical protein